MRTRERKKLRTKSSIATDALTGCMDIEIESSSWALLKVQLPHRAAVNVGVVLKDEHDVLHIRCLNRWWTLLSDYGGEQWEALSADLQMLAQEVGAQECLEQLSLAAHTIVLSPLHSVVHTSASSALDHLYQTHVADARLSFYGRMLASLIGLRRFYRVDRQAWAGLGFATASAVILVGISLAHFIRKDSRAKPHGLATPPFVEDSVLDSFPIRSSNVWTIPLALSKAATSTQHSVRVSRKKRFSLPPTLYVRAVPARITSDVPLPPPITNAAPQLDLTQVIYAANQTAAPSLPHQRNKFSRLLVAIVAPFRATSK